MAVHAYFAYGTTQRGFAHHRRLAPLLSEPIGRYRTASAHAVVVPRRAACSNPGCPYVHRMAALVPGLEPRRVDGDLFLVSDAALAELDRLETAAGAPYIRATVAVTSSEGTREAEAYLARDPERWRALVAAGRADALESYPRELAGEQALKACCVRAPGHAPPHDVVDPLAQAP
jgi:gamma-glutamylcyclotransferase (GGCT)/AIG2-like uncharacterized protein YtfP